MLLSVKRRRRSWDRRRGCRRSDRGGGAVNPKRAARIAAFVTLGVVGAVSFGRAAIAGSWDLLINAPFLTALLGAPLAAAAGILTYRWRTATDAPETDAARSSDEWIAAVRGQLAPVEDPRERPQFRRAVGRVG